MLNPLSIGHITIPVPVILAPMAGITDLAFRRICKQMGCGMVITEMVSAKGLYYKDDKSHELMQTHPEEAPVGIQIFGSDERIMAWAADKLNEMPHAFLDINMGCPAPKIVKNGDGAALMREPEKAGRIIRAVAEASVKPVTVKIRKGWQENEVNALEMARIAEANGASAVTVHGRTRDQFYAGEADWEIIRQVKEAVQIPVIGNGDLFSAEAVLRMVDETGCDGVMIGRGAQGNPWIFRDVLGLLKHGYEGKQPDGSEIYAVLQRHLQMVTSYKGEWIAVKEMRKHAAWYTKGLPGSAAIRHQINRAETADDMLKLLSDYLLRDLCCLTR
ncbi:tRNA dihydrouridine synthase DusB [Anoxynatronum sibiricum]|uniref:tRNA-dihydrouridine synthase n=1 Tax=Anoxynatronum sibiricum TaxID=210623 RepID=A0ABU9VUR3_9CLOT